MSKLIFFTGIIAIGVAAVPSDYYNNDIHTTYEEKSKQIEVPIYKKYAINIPYPVPHQQQGIVISQPQPIPIRVSILTDKLEPVIQEKKVEFIVEKPYPIFTDKKLEIPIFVPRVVHVPYYRHIYRT